MPNFASERRYPILDCEFCSLNRAGIRCPVFPQITVFPQTVAQGRATETPARRNCQKVNSRIHEQVSASPPSWPHRSDNASHVQQDADRQRCPHADPARNGFSFQKSYSPLSDPSKTPLDCKRCTSVNLTLLTQVFTVPMGTSISSAI